VIDIIELNKIYNMDCMDGFDILIKEGVKPKAILTDLPYGTTNRNKWDVIIPFETMWNKINKTIDKNIPVLLFADEPFTSQLICSNLKQFKQRITWDKDRGSGFLNAKKMLLKQTEDICLFYDKLPTYNPQMVEAQADRIRPISDKSTESMNYGKVEKVKAGEDYNPNLRYPTNLIKFSSMTGDCNNVNRMHPTQKPIELLEWLIKTYTNEGDLILDFTCGVASTAIACINTNRNYIGFELDNTYYELGCKRIDEHLHNINLHNKTI
jgi:site-specific DNA-methyltransferase (adenine-specific)